jgi:hypothetical protein
MSPLEENYVRLARGDPDTVGRLVARQSPHVAALAAAARKARAAAPSPAPSAPRGQASIAASASAPAAAPRPSRAAQHAEIHLAGVNDGRKRAGLALLTAAELATEFADLDRSPQARSKLTRREAGNAMAQRLGGAPDGSSGDRRHVDWHRREAQRDDALERDTVGGSRVKGSAEQGRG